MFGNSSKKENNSMASVSTDNSSPGGINSLGQGTKLVGDLNAQNDMRIDGTLEGNLHCAGKLILGPKGFINGQIDCQNAVIEGNIDGIIIVKELLQVKESAKITGEITTAKMKVQPGAIINVKCNMGGQKIVPATSTKKTA